MKGRASAVAAIAVAAGCGGGHDGQAARPRTIIAPPPLDACESAGAEWSPLATSGYPAPDAAVAGAGRFGVVFLNDSTNDACAWTGFARELSGRGYVVAVFDGANAGYQVDQALSVAAALRRREGVRRVVAIGASVGARAALVLGADHRVDFLHDRHRRRVRTAIVRFLGSL